MVTGLSKKFLVASAVALSAAIYAAPAHAGSVVNMFAGAPSLNDLEDGSREGFFTSYGGTAITSSAPIGVGTTISGFFNVDSVNSASPFSGPGSQGVEYTAIFALRITAVNTSTGVVTFGADSAFGTAMGVTGAAVAFYQDSSNNHDFPTGPATFQDGQQFWTLGFDATGKTQAYAYANVPITGNVGANNSIGTVIGTSYFAFDELQDNSAIPGLDNVVARLLNTSETDSTSGATLNAQFVGSSSLRGSAGSPGGSIQPQYAVIDNTHLFFTITAAPLPSAVWPGGAMLGALGVARLVRRRKVAVA